MPRDRGLSIRLLGAFGRSQATRGWRVGVQMALAGGGAADSALTRRRHSTSILTRSAQVLSARPRHHTTTTLSAQPTSAATPSAFTTLSVSVSTTIKWGRPPNLYKRRLISKHNPVMFKAYPESKWSLLLIVWLVYLCLIRKQNFYNFDVIFCGIFAHSFHWLHENRVCNWSM